jgi:hypothetical protein
MNRLALATLLTVAATPALAQPAPQPAPDPPQVQALRALLAESRAGEEQAATAVFEARQQMEKMQAELTRLRAEAAKAASAKTEAPKP